MNFLSVGGTPQAVLGKIVTGQAPSASAERSSVPPNVDAAIRKALEKVPADRFASAKESAQALGDPSFRHGVEQAVAGTGATGSRWTTTALVAAALAVGVAGTAVATGAFGADEPEGVVRFTIELGEDAPFRPSDGWATPSIAISPAGNLIAYTGPSPDGSGQRLYLRSLDQLVATPLAGAEGGVNPFFSPDGQSLGFVKLPGNQLYRIPILGGAPVLVAEAEGPIAGGSWGADDQIIFASGDGSGEIRGTLFRVAAAGGEPEPLTDLQLGESQTFIQHTPSIIGGQDAVLFTANPAPDPSTWEIVALDLPSRELTPLGLFGLGARYVASGHLVYVGPDASLRAVRFDPQSFEVKGSPVALVESVDWRNFGVSRDGRLIYALDPAASAGGAWQLVWVDRDGTEELLPLPPGAYEWPRVSPDGRRVAVGVGRGRRVDLWVHDVSTGAGLRLSEHDGRNSVPVWSPDGSRIYFSSDFEAEPPGPGNIYSVPSDGSGPPVRVMPMDGDQLVVDITPDGRTLLYTDVYDDRGQVMSVPADGSGDPSPVVEGRRSGVVISPDGRWMAYQANGSGGSEVYIEPYPGSGARVPVSIGGGLQPYWSADGRELYYGRPSDLMVMAAEIGGDATPEVISRTELFSVGPYRVLNRQFHVARGGRFLMMRRPESANAGTIDQAPRIVMVLNWFEELEARVPAN